jgi:hypothetical protein
VKNRHKSLSSQAEDRLQPVDDQMTDEQELNESNSKIQSNLMHEFEGLIDSCLEEIGEDYMRLDEVKEEIIVRAMSLKLFRKCKLVKIEYFTYAYELSREIEVE